MMQTRSKHTILTELLQRPTTHSSNMQHEPIQDVARKRKCTDMSESPDDCTADKNPTAAFYGDDNDDDSGATNNAPIAQPYLELPSYIFENDCESVHAYVCASRLGKLGEQRYYSYTVLVGDRAGELHYCESGRIPPEFRECSGNGIVYAFERLLTTVCSNDGRTRMGKLHIHSFGNNLQKIIEDYLPYWEQNGWRMQDGTIVAMKPVLQRIKSLLLSPTSPENLSLCSEAPHLDTIRLSATRYEMGSHSWWLERARGCCISYLYIMKELETKTDKAIVGGQSFGTEAHATSNKVPWYNKNCH